MPNYEILTPELEQRIRDDNAAGTYPKVGFDDRNILRRSTIDADRATVWRPAFVHDIDKILHCPYYNRYNDKTQVFSLIRNDDICRRSLHVQLVSRIARTIGRALHLNLDLIEAIALGHDIGHPPFAHSGERYLDELYFTHAGRHFSHGIHSVRVLDGVFPLNVSLQVLDGIACHNGEVEIETCTPSQLSSFEEFDRMIEGCYEDGANVLKMIPSTLEGAVVRISDIIAYLGKDRQDAARLKLVPEEVYSDTPIGSINAEIINNLTVNIIENSYGKPYIKLDTCHFQALRTAKQENYARIYGNVTTYARLEATAKPMMAEIYDQMLFDLTHRKSYSPIFRQHINYVNRNHYHRSTPYEQSEPNQIVVDYIASMTDDYLIDLHHHLFPDSPYQAQYIGYFDDI